MACIYRFAVCDIAQLILCVSFHLCRSRSLVGHFCVSKFDSHRHLGNIACKPNIHFFPHSRLKSNWWICRNACKHILWKWRHTICLCDVTLLHREWCTAKDKIRYLLQDPKNNIYISPGTFKHFGSYDSLLSSNGDIRYIRSLFPYDVVTLNVEVKSEEYFIWEH